MAYSHHPTPPPLLDIIGSTQKFPVRNIYCVGRNYAAHIRELGGKPETDSPVFFTKQNADLLVIKAAGKDFTPLKIPSLTKDFQPEIELVLAMGKDNNIFGRAVGLDMTRRDIQAGLKAKSLPWDMSKVFEHSAICGAITTINFTPEHAIISLKVNNEIRQKSGLNQMIYSEAEIIEHLGRYINLKAGDLIYTGTPAGVAPIIEHDKLHGQITGLQSIKLKLKG